MNRKYLNSALIVLLVIIWGSVFYKYFGNKGTLDKKLYSSNLVSNNIKEYGIAKDTFKLNLINRDPFGVSKKVKKMALSKPIKTLKVKHITKKSKPLWPTITYHGFVKGKNKSTRLILLKINNRLYRKREKQEINNIGLVKAYDDSLIVALNNTKKTIKRQ